MTTNTEDEFEAAFKKSNATVAAALKEVALPQTDDTTDGSVAEPVQEEVITEEPAAAPAPAPAAAPAAPAPAPVAAPVAAAPAPAAPAPAPAPAADDDNDPVKLRARLSTVQGLLRAASDENKQLKASAATAPAPAPAPAAAPAAPSAEDAESAEVLKELEESAPTVFKAVKALLKTETTRIERTFEERVKERVEEITGRIAPIEAKHKAQDDESHFATIAKAHPDWQNVVGSPELMTWVQKQPSYVQREFQRIAELGTAQEVIEVLDQYRAAHPVQPAAAPAPAAPTNPSAHDAKREAQKRALGTQPARSAPVAPNPAAAKPADFDSAFDAVARRAAPQIT